MLSFTCHPMIADAKYTLCVEYSYTPGCPARGPSYASGGEHAEDPEIEITALHLYGPQLVGRLEVPGWLAEQLTDYVLEHHIDDLCNAAEEQSGPDPDEAYERARDDKAEAGR